MKPGLIMVIDPRSRRADACVAGMLDVLGAIGHPDVHAARGEHWAAAVIAPPAKLPGCEAGIVSEDGDILIWTGDIDLPDTQPTQHILPQATGQHLLRRLRHNGLDALASIDGAFCGAWYDHANDRWAIFNDRLGLLPIFYIFHCDRLVVAPSAALAWQAADLPLTISEDGVADLLRTMNTTEDYTLLKNVHWLRGGHAIIYNRHSESASQPRIHKYWEFRHQPTTNRTPDDAIDEYLHVLGQAIDRQTTGALSIMLGLSGGMDSRLILAKACELGRTPTCFTVGWPFSEDVRFARRLARKARATHTFIPIDVSLLPDRLERFIIETDGLHSARHMAFGSSMPDYLAGFNGSVLLEGHFHGVVGGGYVPADDDLPTDKPPHACAWARKHAHGGANPDTINNLLHPEIASRTMDRWQTQLDDRYDRAPSDDPFQRAEYAIINGRSGRNDVLGPALQRHDVVVRSPAIARSLLEWAARTPGPWRRGKQLYMEALRRRFPRFARVQKSDYNGLPIAENILLREYCWQRERIHQWLTRRSHPQTRDWGTGADYNTAIAFETWKNNAGLARLIDPDARVLAWVDGDRLRDMWQQALSNPTTAALLLSLGTIETYIRHLEQCSPLRGSDVVSRIRFQTFAACEETACASY